MTCGLGDPCVPQLDGTLTTDTTTAEMKKLFQIGFLEHPDEWLAKNEVYQLVRSPDIEIFGWLDLSERSGQTTFGRRLRGFIGRSLGGIYLQIDDHDNRRPRFRFTQDAPPIQENMAAAVLGIPQTPSNQENTCQPRQPRQRLQPQHVSLNHQTDVSVIHGRGAEVPNVDMVASSDTPMACSMAGEGGNVNLPGEQRPNVNLRHDEHGCPLPPVGLVDPEPPIQPMLLPVMDLGTRLERVLDSVNLFDHSPGAQLRSWTAPLYTEHWDL